MNRMVAGSMLWLAWGLAADERPKFEIADVHVSAKTQNPYPRTLPVHGGRYEIKTATMVDLIHIAYGFDADKILGGPNWLEMDRFDIAAKLPDESNPDTQKLMLQALLEDRFKLVAHKDTKPLPTYALIAGKKPQLKEADATGQTGCHPAAASGASGEGTMRLMMGGPNGTTTFNLGPGMVVQYQCRNMSMASFAGNLRSMIGTNLSNPVSDETGLKGNWDFDIRFSIQLNIGGPMMATTADRISIFDAVDKQLGLKLEERQVPTPVMVVDSVNQKPSENPPGLAEALPPIPAPTEFEVASIKQAESGNMMMRFQTQPGGRLIAEGMSLRFLVNRAFNTNNNEAVVLPPKFADTDRFDIIAKAPSMGPNAPPVDNETLAPMIRTLLADRFKMTYHTEDRPVSAYSLVAGKPKMKKADPASRTYCKNVNAPVGVPPGSRVLACQNVTMAQFADRLQGMTQELVWPVVDATGIEGGWDFTLTFAVGGPMMPMPGGRGGGDAGAAGAAVPTASDPTGGLTIFEAVDKQLGLKLEKQKRTLPVTVIDRLEQKPTEN